MMFWTFLPHHETCVKNEGGFSSWIYYGQKTLSIFSNASYLAKKHHFNKTCPDVWDRGFVEMKGNEGDEGLLIS